MLDAKQINKKGLLEARDEPSKQLKDTPNNKAHPPSFSGADQ